MKPELREFGLIKDKNKSDAKSERASEATVDSKKEVNDQTSAEKKRRGKKRQALESKYRKLRWLLSPMNMTIQWLHVEHKFATGDLSEIQSNLKPFEKHANSQPTVTTCSMLAFANLKLKNYSKAAEYYRQILELDSENAVAERGLAEIALIEKCRISVSRVAVA